MNQLGVSGEQRATALAGIRGSVWRLSQGRLECRIVQMALQVADRSDAENLVAELHGHVIDALESPNANFVIQKVVEIMPTSVASFVSEELVGLGVKFARHRFGCRIISRILEHSPHHAMPKALVEELLARTEELSRHTYGRHSIISLLEHGTSEHQARIASCLCHDVARNSRNRNASYVIEKAMLHCSDEDRAALANQLLCTPGCVQALALNHCGSYVLKTLMRLPTEHSEAARCQVLGVASELSASKRGQQVLKEAGLSGPRRARRGCRA